MRDVVWETKLEVALDIGMVELHLNVTGIASDMTISISSSMLLPSCRTLLDFSRLLGR